MLPPTARSRVLVILAALLGPMLVAGEDDSTPSRRPALVGAAAPVLLDCVTSIDARDRIRSLGVVMYPWFGSGIDPQSETSGSIDVGKLVAAIERRLGPDPSGWAMLDFEEPFDSWMALPPDDTKNIRARSELLRVIRSVKMAFPRVKWAYYALLRLRRYIPGPDGENRGWHFLSEQDRDREIARCRDTYVDLMSAQDWFCPSFYDVYENSRFSGDSLKFMLLNEAAWQRASCRFVKSSSWRPSRDPAPLLPCVTPFFQPGGLATPMKAVPLAEFSSDQLQVALAEGADGFCMWSGIDFVLQEATVGTAKDKVAVEVRNSARSAWKDLYFAGKERVDWSSDETRIVLARAIGDAITGAVEITCRELARRSLRSAQPETAPADGASPSPTGSP
jgi:hypothetical protein